MDAEEIQDETSQYAEMCFQSFQIYIHIAKNMILNGKKFDGHKLSVLRILTHILYIIHVLTYLCHGRKLHPKMGGKTSP